MYKSNLRPVMMALSAALLFGASSPVTKILLGNIQPVPLAALLYLGSGFGLLIFQTLNFASKRHRINEAPLRKKDFLWLSGAVIAGGVAAPVILLSSLRITPASTASLLLNFEGVATAAIAMMLFREKAEKQIISGVILVTIAGIILSWDFKSQWGFSVGSLGIILACFCWGLDNNFTANISSKNPFSIVTIKGIASGSFSLILSLLLKNQFPDIRIAAAAMATGFICYGMSIVLFVFAMRDLGSTRTSSLFAAAPFIGVVLSFLLLGDKPGKMFFAALPVMIAGAVFLAKEEHNHRHLHKRTEHEHRHRHDDGHHWHDHPNGERSRNGYHSHTHIHEEVEHTHPHSQDIHHKH